MNRIWLSLLLLLVVAACSREESAGGTHRTTIENPSPAIGPDGKLVQAVGLETQAGAFEALLEQGCALPCVAGRDFVLSGDKREMQLALYRGTSAEVKDAHRLGLLVVRGLKAPPQGEEVTVMFSLGASSQGLTVDAHQMGENVDLELDWQH